jgi:hypothetical protein
MEQLRTIGLAAVTAASQSVFDSFITLLEQHTDRLNHDRTAQLSDLKMLSTKAKGDIFELLCRQYLLM